MARLTGEERGFRKNGSGLPVGRWWPFAMIFICATLAGMEPVLLQNCLGMDWTPHIRGKAAIIYTVVAVPCSPFLLKGGPWQWALFFGIWAPLPFAIINWRWSKRNSTYWAKVRLRERELRRLRKAKAKAEASVANEAEPNPIDKSSST